MSAAPTTDRKVDLYLREPHHPHLYVSYAAVRLHDDHAVEEALEALQAMPLLPEAVQAERDRALHVLHRAWNEGNAALAQTARWSDDAPSIEYVLDMGAPDSGGRVWLHARWNEMVSQFVAVLSHRLAHRT